LVRAAKKEGLPITCDVGAHHVHLTDNDLGFFDSNARLSPPLRSQRDRDAIRQGLVDGTIDVICSDHTPVDDDEKQLPFGEASPGATGLELLLPLALRWATECAPQGNVISLAVAKITSEAARVAGLQAGSLAAGAAADICIFDPEMRWKIEPRSLASQGKHTPFLGYELEGRTVFTLVSGQIVHSLRGA
jgi:dihydroorotase